MAWSGGIFSRTDGVATGGTLCQDQANANTEISAVRMDGEFNNLTEGINQSLNKDGTNQATANLNLGNKKVFNVANGTASGDAVNKGQMDTADNLLLPLNGSRPMTGALNAGNFKVVNLASGGVSTDAVNKGQMDTADNLLLPRNGSRAMTGVLNAGGFTIFNVANAGVASDAVNKGQMDTADNLLLPRNGSRPMLAPIQMGNYKIESLGTPTISTDAVNKNYVDTNFVDDNFINWTPQIAAGNGTLNSSNVGRAKYKSFMGQDLVYLDFEIRATDCSVISVALWASVLSDQSGYGLAKHVTSEQFQRFLWHTAEGNKQILYIRFITGDYTNQIIDSTKTFNISLLFMV